MPDPRATRWRVRGMTIVQVRSCDVSPTTLAARSLRRGVVIPPDGLRPLKPANEPGLQGASGGVRVVVAEFKCLVERG